MQRAIRRAIVLVAGRGSRLGELTEDRPKCMVEMAGVPLLGWTLQRLADAGVPEAVLVVGYRSRKIRDFVADRFSGMEIGYVENERYAETGTAYSLWLARQHLAGDVLLLEGDILFDSGVLDRILTVAPERSAWAAVPVRPGYDEGILLEGEHGERIRRVELVRDPERRSTSLAYKCGGIQLLLEGTTRRLAAHLDEAIAGGRVKVFADLILGEILSRRPIYLCSLEGLKWAEVDDPGDLRRAERIFDGVRPQAGGAQPRRRVRAGP